MKRIFLAIVFGLPMMAEAQTLYPEAASQPAAYGSIFTEKTKTVNGFLGVHRLGDRWFFDIPDSMLGRTILVVNRIVKGAQGSFGGDEKNGNETVLEFRKGRGSRIDLIVSNFGLRLDDSVSDLARAIDNSNQPVIKTSFEIKALSANGKGSVIDVTEFIRNGAEVFTNSSAEEINSITAISDAIHIRAVRRLGPSMGSNIMKPVEVNSSLFLLPERPMRSRYFDERVGYFKTDYKDYSTDIQRVKTRSVIHRWRLEVKAEDLEKYRRGELVEPRNPIVYYIDPATPKKWVPWFIKAVNDWQPVFEAAGFKNAIYAREAPEGDSSWNLQDCKAAIVYRSADEANAAGPVIVDPRSGEIMQAHIEFYHGILKLLHNWYMVQAGINDPGARKMEFDDELMGMLIRRVLTHEVGHTLGLEHNWGSSSTVPVERLRDRDWLEVHGHTPSIMDYARFDFVAQPEDHVSRNGLLLRLGDYDRWAIEWGYRVYPQFGDAFSERGFLSRLVSEKLKEPKYWWGCGDHRYQCDPRSMAEDLGADDIVADSYGIKNLQRTIPHLIEWTTKLDEGFDDLADLYSSQTGLVNQYRLYMIHAINVIGGRYRTVVVSSDGKPEYAPIPVARQREAVDFLNRQLFMTPVWLLDKEILSRTGDDPVRLIGDMQVHALALVLGRLDSLASDEAVYGSGTYTPALLLEELRRGIFKELYTHEAIGVYRRNVQLSFLSQLKKVLESQPRIDVPTYVVGEVRVCLEKIRQDILAALKSTKDAGTAAHLKNALVAVRH